eukprot:2886369-Pleurochrysis_carterae.AAC.1
MSYRDVTTLWYSGGKRNALSRSCSPLHTAAQSQSTAGLEVLAFDHWRRTSGTLASVSRLRQTDVSSRRQMCEVQPHGKTFGSEQLAACSQ